MNKKSLLILEIIWIVIGTASIFAAIHNLITSGDKVLIFLIMAVIAFAMALFRHLHRTKG
jgi:hypothetical protein